MILLILDTKSRVHSCAHLFNNEISKSPSTSKCLGYPTHFEYAMQGVSIPLLIAFYMLNKWQPFLILHPLLQMNKIEDPMKCFAWSILPPNSRFVCLLISSSSKRPTLQIGLQSKFLPFQRNGMSIISLRRWSGWWRMEYYILQLFQYMLPKIALSSKCWIQCDFRI